MLINKNEVSVDEAIKFANHESMLLKRRENSMLLSDYQISVLNRNGINYMNYGNVRNLLFEIDNCLEEFFDDELDMVASQLSEYVYYNETKK